MFVRTGLLSLASSAIIGQVVGQSALALDVNSQDSIKSAAKTLAGGIISFYNDSLKKDHVPGLFPTPYYWWEAGSVLNALVEYSYLTGDSQYDATVAQALQFQVGQDNAYMPANQTNTLGNDDQSTWGLAALTAAEVGFQKPANAQWVDYAVNVWNTQAARLDAEFSDNGACGGGLRWQLLTFNNGYDYKNSMSNGNFFLLSARLAKFTGNTTYSQYAEKSFKWSTGVGLVTKDFHVYDGTDSRMNCSSINRIQWTSNQGIYTEGAALMFNVTGTQNWNVAVQGFVNASSVFQKNDTSVLVEVACENNGKCDVDQRSFKGIFARSFARAAIAAPMIAGSVNKILTASAKAAANACTSDAACDFSWTGASGNTDTATASDGHLGEVFNALEVVQALLWPSAKQVQGVVNGNATQSASPSGTSGVKTPQATGAAGRIEGYLGAVLVSAALVMSLSL